jgi:ribosomal-protein-alanine N-acetyltransferase
VLDIPSKFQTRRLLLRWPRSSDADAIFEEYAADPEVTRYMTWEPHTEAKTVSDFLRDSDERRADGTACDWAITFADDDRPFGMFGGRFRGHRVDIGYVLAQRLWNMGLMTEVISTVSEWFLAQAGIYRVWAVCDTENIGSARVLEKSRFAREGLLKRWIVLPNISDEPRDCYVYGRTR